MIHPSAVIDPLASIADDVRVGPFAVIGKDVSIDEGGVIGPHAVIEGETSIGKRCLIYPHATLGTPPQDLKYKGEPTSLKIGDNCVFREGVTINRAGADASGVTLIGNHCYFMANAHVGHDCAIGDGVVLANSVALAGHVTVGHHVWFGGLSGVHQFVTIGDYAFIAAGSMVRYHVPPFVVAKGDRALVVKVNEIGLGRNNFSKARIEAIGTLYDSIRQNGWEATKEHFKDAPSNEEDRALILSFFETHGSGVCRFEAK